MAEINGVKVPFIPVISDSGSLQNRLNSVSENFDQILQKEIESLKFSKHAIQRLESRSIRLSKEQINKIESAVDKANLKGARDSLVLLEDTAFVVNIPNRTVVTAVEIGLKEENIFTNIDSVVIT